MGRWGPVWVGQSHLVAPTRSQTPAELGFSSLEEACYQMRASGLRWSSVASILGVHSGYPAVSARRHSEKTGLPWPVKLLPKEESPVTGWLHCPECGSPDTRHMLDLVFCSNEVCPLFNEGKGAKYIPWRIKSDAEPFANSEGVILSLFSGYLDPELFLTSQTSVDRLRSAIKTIEEFAKALDEAGKVDEM